MKTVEERLAELEEKIKFLETALKAQMVLEVVRSEWEKEVTGLLKDMADTDVDIEINTQEDRGMMS